MCVLLLLLLSSSLTNLSVCELSYTTISSLIFVFGSAMCYALQWRNDKEYNIGGGSSGSNSSSGSSNSSSGSSSSSSGWWWW